MKEKIELEKEKKALVESAIEKDALLKSKLKTVGNYVAESVPVSNNEVCLDLSNQNSSQGRGMH